MGMACPNPIFPYRSLLCIHMKGNGTPLPLFLCSSYVVSKCMGLAPPFLSPLLSRSHCLQTNGNGTPSPVSFPHSFTLPSNGWERNTPSSLPLSMLCLVFKRMGMAYLLPCPLLVPALCLQMDGDGIPLPLSPFLLSLCILLNGDFTSLPLSSRLA